MATAFLPPRRIRGGGGGRTRIASNRNNNNNCNNNNPKAYGSRISGCLLLSCMILFAGAQDGTASTITVCSEAGNTTCAEGGNRVCYNIDGVGEQCGNCLNGYIQIHPDWTEENGGGGCERIAESLYDDFVQHYQPAYRNASLASRVLREVELAIRLKVISAWESQIPPPPFNLEPNKFAADLEEDLRHIAGYRPRADGRTGNLFPTWEMPGDGNNNSGNRRRQTQQIPDAINWVELGAVTDVKNQQRCSCCWAITTAGATEGIAAIQNSYLESLSFQQFVSCDTANSGCDGGDVEYAYDYAQQNSFGGVTSYESYPFVDASGITTSQCETSGPSVAVVMDDPRTVIGYGDDYDFSTRLQRMKGAVSQQPVSGSVNTNCVQFTSYAGGVVTDDGNCSCASTSCIDHAVLLVGYNDTFDPPYWLVKNSWGTDWGEEGYFRVSQTPDGSAGPWGLFGLLGEGIVPLQAANVTGEVATSAPVDVGTSAAVIASGLRSWMPFVATSTITTAVLLINAVGWM